MGKNVRVNLFEVTRGEKTQGLSKTLDEYAALPLRQRWRDDIRLETVERVDSDQYLPVAYHLEFSKARELGPGRLSHNRPLKDIELADDEQFGEDTTAIYLPRKKWLAVLNNHYGIGPTRMGHYFNALDPGNAQRHFDYAVQPMIDRAALERMKRMRKFSSIEITASIGAFYAIDDPLAESVHQAADSFRAQRLSLKLMANEPYKRHGSLASRPLFGIVDKLMKRDDVDRLVVHASDEAIEHQDKMINLIEQRISVFHPASSLKIIGQRYTHGSKIDLIRRVCHGWLRHLD